MDKQEEQLEFARGAIIGALAGDAAGATLEFIGYRPTGDEVKRAMRMVGGGVWRTAPGQVTDDGELTLALAHSLAGQQEYDPARTAKRYREWFLSDAFDIGNATRAALGSGHPDSPDLADEIMRNALRHNSESKANGSLMRASALGVWSSKIALADAIDAARQDARLTHPHPTCQWACAAYVVAIRHLLRNHGDAEGAFQVAREVVSGSDAVEVKGWLDDAQAGMLPAFHPLAGFVRIGFTHAFHHLVRGSSYETAIFETLSGGGDTDTNACIVGGLVGALHGVSSIPEEMHMAIIRCDTSKGRPRPEWLCTKRVEGLIESLIA